MMAMIKIEACNNIPAPSKVTDSIAAVVDDFPRTRISEARESANVARVINS